MQTKENIFNECRTWLDETAFNDAHVFGSLVNGDGAQFQKHRSDVDIVGHFQKDIDCLERASCVWGALAPTKKLNLWLLAELSRKDACDPITSIVPVLPRELELGVHKGGSKDFFSHNDFVCVNSGRASNIGKAKRHSSRRMDSVFEALMGAQGYRNKFLSVSPNGTRKVGTFSGPDSLPKDLSRSAAQVRWAREANAAENQRFDINEGQVYMLQLVAARRNQNINFEELFKVLSIRMGGRGGPAPITTEQQVLMWEILADDAFDLVPSHKKIEKTVYQRRPLTASIKLKMLKESGNRCGFPGCGIPLGANGIAEFASIRSISEDSARFDPDWPIDKLMSPENIIVLCPTHHREIDRYPEQYPTSEITRWNTGSESESVEFNAKNIITLLRLILRLGTGIL
jgi:hypothetical protein